MALVTLNNLHPLVLGFSETPNGGYLAHWRLQEVWFAELKCFPNTDFGISHQNEPPLMCLRHLGNLQVLQFNTLNSPYRSRLILVRMCVCVYMHMCIHMCVYVCMHVFVCVCMHTHVYLKGYSREISNLLCLFSSVTSFENVSLARLS